MRDYSLKAGKLVMFTTGEYSDFGHCGVFVVLKDMSHDEFKSIAKKLKDDFQGDYWEGPSEYEMMSELTKNGYLLDIDMKSIHLGEYGRLDI
jgi:hypothetical protein